MADGHLTMDFVEGWQPLAVLSVTLGFLAVGAVYAVARIFDFSRLRAMAKAEFAQAVVSALLIGLLLTLTLGISAVSEEFTEGKSPPLFAAEYLESVNTRIEQVGIPLEGFAMVVSAIRDLEVHIGTHELGVSGKPFAGLENATHQLDAILSAIAFVKWANLVQIYLFGFIGFTMLTYFLPVGVVLRAFAFTRPVGAFFMAVALGSYFVLPLTYVVNKTAVEHEAESIDAYVANLTAFDALYSLSNVNLLDVQSVNNFVADLLAHSVWDQFVTFIAGLYKLIAEVTVQVTFFPLFNFGVMFLSIRQLYRVLASEVPLWT
ncbi:MAG: hypothetical protein Q8P02_00770 [Candidatus Micrarchaeota archaeon]|nr:hypothetical protein [Candidatus Micrarchaeota archaeon]